MASRLLEKDGVEDYAEAKAKINAMLLPSNEKSVKDTKLMLELLDHIRATGCDRAYLYKRGLPVQILQLCSARDHKYTILPDVVLIDSRELLDTGKMKITDATPFIIVEHKRGDRRDCYKQLEDGDAKAYNLYDALVRIVQFISDGYSGSHMDVSVDRLDAIELYEYYKINYEIV